MDRTPTTTMVNRRLETCSDAPRQALLLLVILKELVLLLHALLRGNISLADVLVRLQPPPPPPPQEHSLSSSRLRGIFPAPVSESQDSDSTCDVPERLLVSAVQALCRAIVQRDLKSVSRMLEAAPSLTGKRHEGGWFPLHAAVLSGDVEIVNLVLSHPNVDVNAEHGSRICSAVVPDRERELGTCIDDTSGATPLHYACMIGNIDIIKVLVQYGALFDVQDDKEREPVEYFDMHQHEEAITVFHNLFVEWRKRDEFYHDYASVDDLAELIRKDKYDLFERTIKRNPQLASKFTYYDFTLLHLAVIRQRRPFVELLLSIDPSLANEVDNRSAWVCKSSHTSFAPPTLPHKHVKNATPLHYAFLTQDMDIIALLLKAGADWTIKDYRGRKPEDLLYGYGTTCDHMKYNFARLRDAEEERRKKASGEDVRNEKASERDGIGGFGSKEDARQNLDGESEKEEAVPEEPANGQANDNRDNVAPPKVSIHSLLSLEKVLEEKLVGQRGPILSVANAIRLRESGWVDPDRPLTMLFLGSSGVGKTELAKQLSLYIHGKDGLATNKGETVDKLEKEYAFVRIDMSEYQSSHTAFNLIGAPKSYVGYGDGGALTQPLRKNPKAIVLLDEIEKAHPDVLTLFLQVFDDGRITDSKDGVIFCKDAIFIMTSNVASSEIKEKAPELRRLVAHAEEQGRPEIYMQLVQQFTRSIHPTLKQALKRDEFLGRINQMVVFLPLSEEDIELVVKRELIIWRKRADEKHNIRFRWTDEVVRKLAIAYDVNYGVRSVVNEVQRVAVRLVADAQMRGQISENWHASLNIDECGDIIMNASLEA